MRDYQAKRALLLNAEELERNASLIEKQAPSGSAKRPEPLLDSSESAGIPMIDLDGVRAATSGELGKDINYAYLTEAALAEARGNARAVSERAGQMEGNALIKDGTTWKWRKGCASDPDAWLAWSGQLSAERIGTCGNGLIHYSIKWS